MPNQLVKIKPNPTTSITLSDISAIRLSSNAELGRYEIHLIDGRSIYLTKKRTIIALLILIHKGVGSQSDLAQGNSTIPQIRKILGSKMPSNFVLDSYSDANKPFSELWNEEGFSFITNNTPGQVERSKAYHLNKQHHALLFTQVNKANRRAPSKAAGELLLQVQQCKCNFCGSTLKKTNEISSTTFAKDHVRLVADHRIPIEKGGNSSDAKDYQLLCFYCNKTKWQICSICKDSKCTDCALAYPEQTNIVYPTKEDISSRLSAHYDNRIKVSD